MPASRLPATLALCAALCLAASACAPWQGPGCRPGEQPSVHDALYFGTAKPDGTVTAAQWAGFLETVVTPRFPQGLTVNEASGQWRGANGATVREASHVLHLVHADDPASEKAVTEIVAAYKSQFQQEAVLRVRAAACVSL
ncbi:MAG TPA: DUF3574 domain-containing protein [Ideonella sp.]|nr:DUF3574 domain-containing protein [Ideonella sp.]